MTDFKACIADGTIKHPAWIVVLQYTEMLLHYNCYRSRWLRRLDEWAWAKATA